MKKLTFILLGICLFLSSASFAAGVQSIDKDAWLDHVAQMQILRENMLQLMTKNLPTAADRAELAKLKKEFSKKQDAWQNYLEKVAKTPEPCDRPECADCRAKGVCQGKCDGHHHGHRHIHKHHGHKHHHKILKCDGDCKNCKHKDICKKHNYKLGHKGHHRCGRHHKHHGHHHKHHKATSHEPCDRPECADCRAKGVCQGKCDGHHHGHSHKKLFSKKDCKSPEELDCKGNCAKCSNKDICQSYRRRVNRAKRKENRQKACNTCKH
jgi:radical SAM protein with 4Fe4S-binding SPASM domain